MKKYLVLFLLSLVMLVTSCSGTYEVAVDEPTYTYYYTPYHYYSYYHHSPVYIYRPRVHTHVHPKPHHPGNPPGHKPNPGHKRR